MQAKKSFVVDALSFGFRELIEHVRLFVLVILTGAGLLALVVGILALLNKNFVYAAIYSGPSRMPLFELISTNFFSLAISVLVLALFLVGLDLGFKKVALSLYDHENSNVKELVSCFALAPKALVAWILYGAMVWLGWLFFILPGFIALLRFAFFPYFIIDKNAGVIEALRMSCHATKNHIWDMFAFWAAVKIISYFGFVSGIGIVLTWPLSTLAYAYYYRKLVPHHRS